MAASTSGEQIDLEKLSFEQLQQLKMEFQSEVEAIQESIQTLYNCKTKYATSKEALEQIQPEWQDKSILVPLTSSMYVPGTIKDMNNFVIDVGTGYYVEKDLESSKDYFKRRVEYVQEQMEKIEKIQYQKSRFLSVIVGVMDQKQQHLAKQAA